MVINQISINQTTGDLLLKDFISKKGIIFTGGNGSGKTTTLRRLLLKLENLESVESVESVEAGESVKSLDFIEIEKLFYGKDNRNKCKKYNKFYIKLSDIENRYEKEILDSITRDEREQGLEQDIEIELGAEGPEYGIIKFITNNLDTLTKEISKCFFYDKKIKIVNELENKYLEFKYEKGTKIISNGHLNIIKLSILFSYYSSFGKDYIMIDEPNTNLNDVNAEIIIEGIRNISIKVNNKSPLIIATTNNINLIEELEGFIICNVDMEEFCYSSDIIGNYEALKRITSNHPTQKKLISRNKEILSKMYLKEINWYQNGFNIVVKNEFKIDGVGNRYYETLNMNEFTNIEKILWDRITKYTDYSGESYDFRDNKAYLINKF